MQVSTRPWRTRPTIPRFTTSSSLTSGLYEGRAVMGVQRQLQTRSYQIAHRLRCGARVAPARQELSGTPLRQGCHHMRQRYALIKAKKQAPVPRSRQSIRQPPHGGHLARNMGLRVLIALAMLLLLGTAAGAKFLRIGGYSPSFAPYPLSVSNGFLVNPEGQPFLMIGDGAWTMMGRLSLGSYGDTLPTASMAAYGFNTIIVDAICASWGAGYCANNSSTPDGLVPFTGSLGGSCSETTDVNCYDLVTYNTSSGNGGTGYFGRLDDMIRLAARYDLNVILMVLDTGSCSSPGWMQTLINNNRVNPAKIAQYATFLGNRYKTNFPNLIYMVGGDYQCYQTVAKDNLVYTFANALRIADPGHLLTLQLSYNLSTSLDDTTQGAIGVANSWSTLVGLNAVYTYYPHYDEIIYARNQSPTQPSFIVETNYENENDTGCDTFSAFRDRKSEWWALTSGASGFIYGNSYVWPFATGWNTASNIDTADVTQLGYLYNFLVALKWSILLPDTASTLVTAGRKTYGTPPISSGSPGNPGCPSSPNTVNTNNYVTAARASDGSFAVVYMPTAGTVTVNLANLGPNVTAQWFDPTTGNYSTICSDGTGNCAFGSRNFTSYGTHSDGASDWVLLLTAPSRE
jgi:hypothetical protein